MHHPGAIPGQGASKNSIFWGQNGPWWWAAISAQKSTWKLENVTKHTSRNGKTWVGHFYAPSRCHSRWWCIQKRPLRSKKQPKWRDAIIDQKSTWKLDNGPKQSNKQREVPKPMCPTHVFPLTEICFVTLSSFQVDFWTDMAAHHHGIFGRSLTWNDTWMTHKSV